MGSKNFDESMNEAILYGRIVTAPEFSHIYNDERFYVCELEIQRFRNSNLESAKYDLVRVFLREDYIFKVTLNLNDLCMVTGKLVTSKVNDMYDLSVVADEITKLDNLDDPKLSSGVKVSGKVTHIFTNEENYKGFINFVVAQFDEEGKKLFSTRIVIWNKLSQYVMSSTKVGDIVNVRGCINNVKCMVQDTQEEFYISEILGLAFYHKDTNNTKEENKDTKEEE